MRTYFYFRSHPANLAIIHQKALAFILQFKGLEWAQKHDAQSSEPGEQHTIHLPSFYELHSPYNSTRHLLFYPKSRGIHNKRKDIVVYCLIILASLCLRCPIALFDFNNFTRFGRCNNLDMIVFFQVQQMVVSGNNEVCFVF